VAQIRLVGVPSSVKLASRHSVDTSTLEVKCGIFLSSYVNTEAIYLLKILPRVTLSVIRLPSASLMGGIATDNGIKA